MKRFFVITLLLLGCLTLLLAEKIDHYKVDLNVEQSGELSVTETIVYNFEGTPKHGIVRDIPVQIKVDSVTKDIGLYQFSVQKEGEEEMELNARLVLMTQWHPKKGVKLWKRKG